MGLPECRVRPTDPYGAAMLALLGLATLAVIVSVTAFLRGTAPMSSPYSARCRSSPRR